MLRLYLPKPLPRVVGAGDGAHGGAPDGRLPLALLSREFQRADVWERGRGKGKGRGYTSLL